VLDKVGLHPWYIETDVFNKRGIARIKKRFSDDLHHSSNKFLGNERRLSAQNYAFDFFGDPVDVMVSIDSGTVRAPDSAAFRVLLFAGPKVGAVTEDIMAIRKNFGGR
jgi:hypothetical protein